MLLALVASSVLGFGGWLQGEMKRASLARMQRDLGSAQSAPVFAATQDSPDAHSACAGMSAEDANMMGKGELWCGAVAVRAAVPSAIIDTSAPANGG
ncbi:hypothetical protein LFL96_22980 [Paraburkholderia sp. D15]|uniref:hypothetical protein n=1 Tax=Paraburkholderia sp. D15 TaxID=2880218 RepID=UPI00247960D0|nr:hypothetical protein [Paraburkholderia sp. D15]WGS53905.1 hypothetical protein LFL96_22980 [Paraburkholderia sp. D15]